MGRILLPQAADRWMITSNLPYLRCMTLYKLTLEAQKPTERNRSSKQEMIRRSGASPAQLYRLLDQTNYRKSIDRLSN